MDRHSGQVLWTADAISGFRHNAICLGGGRLYCIDRLSGAELSRLKRRGETPRDKPRLVAFDLATGRDRLELPSTTCSAPGSATRPSTTCWSKPAAPPATRSATSRRGCGPIGRPRARCSGTNLSLRGPAMIHSDTILMAGSACDLLTGTPRMRAHPLTGEPVEWTWSRNYGCNTPMASEHLLTFRSGAAGYFDFCNDGGTGNFGGFRSSCTNNLIVAGGVLTAPDYTRTCTCSYQNQTSLALVHMPDAEMWTSFGSQTPKERGAAAWGSTSARRATARRTTARCGWSIPASAARPPRWRSRSSPTSREWFRRHSSQISGPGQTWVAASGAQGLTSLSIKLADDKQLPRPYTVRLHFAEPDDVAAGERVFSVRVQGKPAISALDVAAEAGGRNRALVKELTDVQVADELVIELTPAAAAKVRAALLCGVEILAEGW